MKTFWIVICIFLVACESSKVEKTSAKSAVEPDPKASEVAPSKVAPKEVEKAKPVEIFESDTIVKRPFEKENLDGFAVKGVVDSGLAWSDKKGRNILIFSKVKKKAEVTFHIQHFVKNANGTEERIDLKEYLYCDRENLAIAVDKARFSVQDLDNDGIGEPTFGYTVECDDDVPNVFKSFLLEDGKRYKLTSTKFKKNVVAGAFEPSATLKSQPLFLKYLSDNWVRK